MTGRQWRGAALGAMVAGWWACRLAAGEPAVPADGEKPALKLDTAAEKTLHELAVAMLAAQRLQCEVTLLMTTEMEGMKQEITTAYALAMERPNKLALRHVRGMAGNSIVSDGKRLTTYAGTMNRYAEQEAPATFEDLFEAAGPMAGNMLFLDNLLRNDVYAAIMEGVLEARYAGKEQVDGQECHHLKFVQEEFDWDLWVTTGPQPAVVKVWSDMTKGFAGANAETPGMKGMRMVVVNRFSGWKVGAETATNAFVFTPPAGARKADTLFGENEEEPPDLEENGEVFNLPGTTPGPMPAKAASTGAPLAVVTNAAPARDEQGKPPAEGGKQP